VWGKANQVFSTWAVGDVLNMQQLKNPVYQEAWPHQGFEDRPDNVPKTVSILDEIHRRTYNRR
jgi:hypothetical protein